MDEAKLDVAMCNPPDEDIQVISEHKIVVCEEDLVERSASISYNDSLHRLTMYLKIPMQMCTYSDTVTGTARPGKPPFHLTLKPCGTGVVLEWVS